jgi:site-specific DNA recombinase
MTVRAVVGARVSHVQGKEKTSHHSQRSKGQAYAEAQGWEVIGAFEDLDVSAIKLSPFERPDLSEWLQRPGDWDALVFAKTDRVFRSAADCVRLAEWCREHHKILVLVDDGIRLDYYHPEDAKDAFAGAMSKVFLILASVFAEIEGQRFVQRSRDRIAFLRGTDRWGFGAPPFGFKIVPHPTGAGKALDFDAEAQTVLSGIVTRFLAGDSLTAISAALNLEKVPSPQDWARIRSGIEPVGSPWRTKELTRILGNPTTQGLKTFKKKIVLDSDGEPVRVGPASFDAETWNRIQQELAQRTGEPRKRRHSTNPLLGVAKCAGCGKNLVQKSVGEYRYYGCPQTPKACRGVTTVAAEAEELVEWEFLRRHRDRRIRERVWRQGSDHSAELEQTKRTIESLREDRAAGLFTTPEDELTYRQQMKALIAKRDALEEMPVVKAGWTEVVSETTYGERWPTATVEEKRKMLTDAGVTLTVTSRHRQHLDTEHLLGD